MSHHYSRNEFHPSVRDSRSQSERKLESKLNNTRIYARTPDHSKWGDAKLLSGWTSAQTGLEHDLDEPQDEFFVQRREERWAIVDLIGKGSTYEPFPSPDRVKRRSMHG